MQLALHARAGGNRVLNPDTPCSGLDARCCAGGCLSFRLPTWDLNVQSFHVLCSCGSLHLDQMPGKSSRSLRPGFRAFDSSAESVDVAHSFGTSCLSANPCQGLQGFADLPAELLTSCSLRQHRLAKPRHLRYLNSPGFVLMETGCEAITPVALPE